MSFNINEFIANFDASMRPNRFKVIITWPTAVGTPNIKDEIVVEGAAMPASVLGMIPASYKGRQIPLPGDRIFEDFTMTLKNDARFGHRDALVRWSNMLNAHRANVQGVADTRQLFGTIEVISLDLNERPLKTVRLLNAWPSNVTQIDLAYDQNDMLAIYTATFSYSDWEDVNAPTT